MLKWFNKKKKDNKGFTLVELVIVVAILAILVGLLAPQYTKYVEKSRKSADASNLENMVRAVEIGAADATESIPKGGYKITLSPTDDANVTGVAYDSTTPSAKDIEKVTNILKATIAENWDKTMLKSSKWKDVYVQADGTAAETISATCNVDAEGAVTVTYVPAAVKDMA
ncbi:MAG: prepilin-type N-terminal cleavage/methylation domain-containing protein [Eubacteriales bacterium]|nr:prepilin-type N-terminal cleavage/methylation domain-containing protein [Eubacteriales bacterium]